MTAIPRYRRLEETPFASALVTSGSALMRGESYDAVRFSEVNVDHVEASNALFTECAFTNVTFDGGGLRRARFRGAWVGEARLVGTDVAESSWMDVTLDDSVLAGIEAFSTEWRRVVFQSCKLNSVNLRHASIHDAIFEDCVLADVDFTGATLARVRFPGSRLADVDFARSSLDELDLRGATLELVKGCQSLRGATIDYGQLIGLAPTLADALGITVDTSPSGY